MDLAAVRNNPDFSALTFAQSGEMSQRGGYEILTARVPVYDPAHRFCSCDRI